MYNDAYIGLVDPHAEGVCGYHHAYFVVFPAVLFLGLVVRIKAGMIEVGRYAGVDKQLSELHGATARASIYYRRAGGVEQRTQHTRRLILIVPHYIAYIWPGEAARECMVSGAHIELVGNIGDHSRSGCGCKSQHGGIGE